MNRRTVLEAMLATGATALLGACGRRPSDGKLTESPAAMPQGNVHAPSSPLMPVTFLAHGSPLLLDDKRWVAELHAWGGALPRPKAILVLSAHWVQSPIRIGATTPVPLYYDFYGFPQRYFEVKYPSPGAPDLAQRVKELLGKGMSTTDSSRGLDHGAYIPLIAMYPEADIPVLQISIPTMDPGALVALGKALAPLRREGVLIMGSGFLTHNMHAIDWDGTAGVPAWASEFDAWNKDAILRRDVDALVKYREIAPGVETALPTQEHYVPVLVALGASLGETEAATFPIEGFTYGSFTKRSVQFG